MTDMSSTIRGLSEITETKLTEDDVKRIQRISNYFNLRENDPFISVIISLEHYFKLCKSVPIEFAEHIENEKYLENKFVFIKWACAAIFILSLCICGVSYGILKVNKKNEELITSLQTQIQELRTFNEESSVFTPKMYNDLYFLYKNGDLEPLIYCKIEGWEIRDGMCLPLPIEENGNKKVLTWRVPVDAK